MVQLTQLSQGSSPVNQALHVDQGHSRGRDQRRKHKDVLVRSKEAVNGAYLAHLQEWETTLSARLSVRENQQSEVRSDEHDNILTKLTTLGSDDRLSVSFLATSAVLKIPWTEQAFTLSFKLQKQSLL